MKLHDIETNTKPVEEQLINEGVSSDDPQIKAALSFMGLDDPTSPEYKSHYNSLKSLKKNDPASFKRAMSFD